MLEISCTGSFKKLPLRTKIIVVSRNQVNEEGGTVFQYLGPQNIMPIEVIHVLQIVYECH